MHVWMRNNAWTRRRQYKVINLRGRPDHQTTTEQHLQRPGRNDQTLINAINWRSSCDNSPINTHAVFYSHCTHGADVPFIGRLSLRQMVPNGLESAAGKKLTELAEKDHDHHHSLFSVTSSIFWCEQVKWHTWFCKTLSLRCLLQFQSLEISKQIVFIRTADNCGPCNN